MLRFDTTSSVIDALGGNAEVIAIVGGRTKQQNVTNWRAANRFPPHTFFLIQRELQRRGLGRALASLWGIIDPDEVTSVEPCPCSS